MPILQRLIEVERQKAVAEIRQYYRGLYHSHVILLPNARFGLYAAARELLRPGDAALISPLTCRSVIDALTAAGVRPVLVDIELETGNIDVSRLQRSVLDRARAIVTTNLYGNPDRTPDLEAIAHRYGLLLIEDCAHVFRSSIDGRGIGSIGDLSVFSFKKYFDEPGGVITVRSESAAQRIAGRVAQETIMPSEAEDRRRYLRDLLRRATGPMVGPLSTMYGKALSHRAGTGDASGAERPAAARVQLPDTAALCHVARILSESEAFLESRRADCARFAARCPLPLKTNGDASDVCFLVMPFFTEQRDAIVSEMLQRGIPTYFRYSPPMNELFEEYTTGGMPDPLTVRAWCNRILPTDPRFANQYLEVITRYAANETSQLVRNTVCKN